MSGKAQKAKTKSSESSGSEDYPGHEVGRYHEHTSEVIKVQIKVGTPPDGVYGPQTEAAVRRWQRARDLEETGVVDKSTWDRMF